MALKTPHRDWRLEQINPMDVRAVGLDQVLTNLWLCVIYGTRPLVRLSILPSTALHRSRV